MMKQCLLPAIGLLSTTSLADVIHTSEAKGLRIPYGSFTQFRLAGEGLNDDNLHADITQTQHQIEVKGVESASKFGLLSDTKFDVFIFDSNDDYNCYIEATTMWTEHLQANMCDFVGSKPDVIHEQVDNWSSSDSVFLSKDKVHNDVFVVLDNTGWLQQVSNSVPKQNFHDVTYEVSIKTTYAANDLYNKVFYGFMIALAVLFATVILMACLYRMQKRAHSQVMETKKELKRISLQKQQEDLRKDLSQMQSSASSILLSDSNMMDGELE